MFVLPLPDFRRGEQTTDEAPPGLVTRAGIFYPMDILVPQFFSGNDEPHPTLVRPMSHPRKKMLSARIRAAGFQLTDFELGRTPHPQGYPNAQLPILRHKGTGYWFILGGSVYRVGFPNAKNDVERFTNWYCPGELHDIETNHPIDWDRQLDDLYLWMHRIKAIVDDPDPLAENAAVAIAEQTIEQNNEEFDELERTKLLEALDQIQQRLTEISEIQQDHAEAQKRIESRFDDLRAATKRLGRVDWFDKFRQVLLESILVAGAKAIAHELATWGVQKVRDAIEAVGETLRLP